MLLFFWLLQVYNQPATPVIEVAASVIFNCIVNNETTDKPCQDTPGAGFSLYITDVLISNGPTAQAIRLQAGTGAGCSSPTNLTPAIFLPVNGYFAKTYKTPIRTPVNTVLCCDTNGATAYSCNIQGYIAP